MLKDFLLIYRNFWHHYPCLFYGLAVYLGVCSAFYPLAAILLILCLGPWKKSVFCILLAGIAFGYVSCHYNLPSETVHGKGLVTITSIGAVRTPFSKTTLYRGVAKKFGKGFRNIPFSAFIKGKKKIAAGQEYLVNGLIEPYHNTNYTLKSSQWEKVSNNKFTLADWRQKAKKKVNKYIRANISDSKSAAFLSGITTGEFNDNIMRFDFGRLGLQHIMAISGFHFTIIAAFLGFFLRSRFRPRKVALILTPLLSSYALFIGNSPSIQRAWICSLLALWATLFERRSYGLNSLGVALAIVLIINPLAYQTIGFQFSFLATASILLLYSPFEHLFKKILPSRPLYTATQMPLIDKHGYIISTILRRGFALTAAIHVTTIPLVLYHFQKFPLLGLIYNLFFPFFVSVALILLLISLTFCWVPILSHCLNWTTNAYTSLILKLTTPPPAFDYSWDLQNINPVILVIYLSLCLLIAIRVNSKFKNQWQFF
jgi:competence protein ComEC